MNGTLAAGARLGAYEILALVGAGGMGEVYKARDARLDRNVAIKILPEALAADPTNYAVTADGERFLVNTVVDQPTRPALTVILNWTAGLKK